MQTSIKGILMGPFKSIENLYNSKWTEYDIHKLNSNVFLLISIVLFVLYKFKFRKDGDKKHKNKFGGAKSKNVDWLDLTNESNFILSVDVDGPKLIIFLNTVFMNNFSISKKLSHNDLYIYHLE